MSKNAAKSGHGAHGHKRAKKHEEEEHENHERWLVSYADMLTLLFALFVVLYSMSQVDVEKFTDFSRGLQEGFGAPVTIPQPQVDAEHIAVAGALLQHPRHALRR